MQAADQLVDPFADAAEPVRSAWAAISAGARRVFLAAGRRGGKTWLNRERLRQAFSSGLEGGRYAVFMLHHAHCNRVYGERTFGPVNASWRGSRATLYFPRDVTIRLLGYRDFRMIEGNPFDGIVFDGADEYAAELPALIGNARAALADRDGWLNVSGVCDPRNTTFEELYRSLAAGGDWRCFSWLGADCLEAEVLDSMRAQFDRKLIVRELEASYQ